MIAISKSMVNVGLQLPDGVAEKLKASDFSSVEQMMKKIIEEKTVADAPVATEEKVEKPSKKKREE